MSKTILVTGSYSLWKTLRERYTGSDRQYKVNNTSPKQYPTPAKRPSYSLMDKTKFCKTFDVQIPQWEKALEKVTNKMKTDEKYR